MLPGFRFLFAAIVLSMSILVFGLGAAALLRAAHEEFASTPSWRASPEPVFAQRTETPAPVLAMLRVEPPAARKSTGPDSSGGDSRRSNAQPVPCRPNRDVAATPPEPEVTAKPVELASRRDAGRDPSVPAGPPRTRMDRRAAAGKFDQQPETAKPEMPVAESPAQQEAAPRANRCARRH